MRDTYCIMDNLMITDIAGMEHMEDYEVLFGIVESGSELWLRDFGLDLDSELKNEGGSDNWTVNCRCEARDDDGERMVSCDICEIWQHTLCCGVEDSEVVPLLFVCQACCTSLAPPRAQIRQDPGNLGTLLRSAIAFGRGGAFLLPGCCDPFNDKVLRASRGASFQRLLVSSDWPHLDTLRNHYNMKVLAGNPANDQKPRRISRLACDFTDSLADKPLCLLLGSEGGGLSEKAMDASELVSIPMTGEFESLNVSIAGGILLYMLQSENHKELSSG